MNKQKNLASIFPHHQDWDLIKSQIRKRHAWTLQLQISGTRAASTVLAFIKTQHPGPQLQLLFPNRSMSWSCSTNGTKAALHPTTTSLENYTPLSLHTVSSSPSNIRSKFPRKKDLLPHIPWADRAHNFGWWWLSLYILPLSCLNGKCVYRSFIIESISPSFSVCKC